MISATYYEPETGKIVGHAISIEQDVQANKPEGCEILSGIWEPNEYRIIDGAAVALPVQPSEFHRFDYALNEWFDSRSVQDMWFAVRVERNRLLSESDWTDTLSAQERLGPELFSQWQAYRQALRDITLQADPFNIVWPIRPGN